MREQPYFMKNEAWYRLKDGGLGYELTKEGKKIPEVVASYEDFYTEERDEDGAIVDD